MLGQVAQKQKIKESYSSGLFVCPKFLVLGGVTPVQIIPGSNFLVLRSVTLVMVILVAYYGWP